MEDMRLYKTVEKFSLFNDYFIYVDTQDFLADGIFIKHKLKVKFVGDWEKDNCKYVMVVVGIPKKRVEEFKECLNELKNYILICGHTDYPSFVSNLFNRMDNDVKILRGIKNE